MLSSGARPQPCAFEFCMSPSSMPHVYLGRIAWPSAAMSNLVRSARGAYLLRMRSTENVGMRAERPSACSRVYFTSHPCVAGHSIYQLAYFTLGTKPSGAVRLHTK